VKSTHRTLFAVLGGFAILSTITQVASAKVEPEIAAQDKRHLTVEKAVLISKQTKASPLPATLQQPFAPPGFDLTDAEEAAAAAAAARLANANTGGSAGPAPPTDRELLESIVAKVRPSGTFFVGGQPILSFGKKFVKTGSHFTVTYKGTDYDLELIEIEGTNFTLRYNHEVITRPIQTAKTPTP
jgi:hypothetical protein